MTREEAIKWLKTFRGRYGLLELEQAVDLAIKVLEQQPTKEEQALLKKWRDARGVSIEDFEDAMNVLQGYKALEKEPKADLDKIKSEIESKMETIIGRYDSTTSMCDMASYKIERNKVREECIEIIDKYRQEG